MAIPTITSVVPATGSSGGGDLIVITGTNFALYVVPDYGFLNGDCVPRVSVLLGGVAPTKVYGISSTEIIIETPPYAGDLQVASFPVMDIVVTNLDVAGLPVAGETVTKTDAFTYSREVLRPPTQTAASPFVRITRALVQMFKRELLLNTGTFTNTDYSVDGIVLVQAELPSFFIIGPDISFDEYGEDNEPVDVILGDGTSFTVPPPEMHTLSYDFIGCCDSKVELLSLMAAVRKIFRRNVKLALMGDYPASELRMPIRVTTEPAMGPTNGRANLHSFSGSFDICRVPVLYLPPDMNSRPIDTIELEAQLVDGTLVEVVPLEDI